MKADAKYLLTGLVILLLTSAAPVKSQYVSNVSKVGTVAAPFLEIGVGSRAIGMGGAYTAVSDEVNGTYWNPAGCAFMKQGEAGFVHSNWIAGINFDNVSSIVPIGNGSFIGGFITSLSMEEMEIRTIDNPEGTGEMFDASDMAFGITYATLLTDRLSLGANGKYIHQTIWNESASSMAIDLGLLFKTPYKDLALGMSISNFGPDMQMTGRDLNVYHDIDPNNPGNNDEIRADLETEQWSLPLIFRFGLAMHVYNGVNSKILLAVDAIHPNDNYEYINLGTEWNWRNWFFLRAGWKTLFLDDTEQGLTFGAGLHYRLTGNMIFVSDVAYADFGRLENVIRYSLGIRF